MENNKYVTLDMLIEKSTEEYKKLIRENRITQLLSAIGLFSDQTITNDILILSQNPNAVCVKRMKEWNYYKRNVKPNEKALKVIAHYINKENIDYTDKFGKIHTKQIEKLKAEIGFVFDINQTQGKEYDYLKTNKETLAKYFEATKKALEYTTKGFSYVYDEMEENSRVDFENKIIHIKSGLTLNETINVLIENAVNVLLYSRYPEGLTIEEKANINEIEKECVVYAIAKKLNLDLPNYDGFNDIQNWNDGEILQFKENLQRVRSVVKQVLSSLESEIEYQIYSATKQANKDENTHIVDKEIEKVAPQEKNKENESEVENA